MNVMINRPCYWILALYILLFLVIAVSTTPLNSDYNYDSGNVDDKRQTCSSDDDDFELWMEDKDLSASSNTNTGALLEDKSDSFDENGGLFTSAVVLPPLSDKPIFASIVHPFPPSRFPLVPTTSAALETISLHTSVVPQNPLMPAPTGSPQVDQSPDLRFCTEPANLNYPSGGFQSPVSNQLCEQGEQNIPWWKFWERSSSKGPTVTVSVPAYQGTLVTYVLGTPILPAGASPQNQPEPTTAPEDDSSALTSLQEISDTTSPSRVTKTLSITVPVIYISTSSITLTKSKTLTTTSTESITSIISTTLYETVSMVESITFFNTSTYTQFLTETLTETITSTVLSWVTTVETVTAIETEIVPTTTFATVTSTAHSIVPVYHCQPLMDEQGEGSFDVFQKSARNRDEHYQYKLLKNEKQLPQQEMMMMTMGKKSSALRTFIGGDACVAGILEELDAIPETLRATVLEALLRKFQTTSDGNNGGDGEDLTDLCYIEDFIDSIFEKLDMEKDLLGIKSAVVRSLIAKIGGEPATDSKKHQVALGKIKSTGFELIKACLDIKPLKP